MKNNSAYLGPMGLRLGSFAVFICCSFGAGHAQGRRKPHRLAVQNAQAPKAHAVDPAAAKESGEPNRAPAALSVPLPAVPQVMLWRLNGLGLSEGIRRNLEALVLSHLRQMPQKTVVAPEVWRQTLSQPAFEELQRCTDGPACLRQRGAAVGADIVVYGTISALGTDYSLNLRALKVADGQELGRQVATLSGNLDQLIPQMRLVTFALLAPDAIWGSLMIDTALAGIEVQVDGVKQAQTPWTAPLGRLKPGPHKVRLDGFSSMHSELTVEVVAFETSQVQVEFARGASGEIKSVPLAPSAATQVPTIAPAALPAPASPKAQ